jgi:hypothetical protein
MGKKYLGKYNICLLDNMTAVYFINIVSAQENLVYLYTRVYLIILIKNYVQNLKFYINRTQKK